ncbi:C-type lectin domain family 19 member A-like, partial [Amphiura filiformis]|uniref:C-type lectin domain family 19 member A-like n=1 Tax=Amphiura filiformis TaxID=82378 RepID=UPI003B21B277
HEWQGHCYNYVAIAKSWSDAEIYCNNQYGAHLVSIHSSAENSFVNGISGSYNVWIGLSDQATEGTFKWSDGSQVNYAHWDLGEPNGGGAENCGHLWSHSVTWNDSICSSKKIFVCKN